MSRDIYRALKFNLSYEGRTFRNAVEFRKSKKLGNPVEVTHLSTTPEGRFKGPFGMLTHNANLDVMAIGSYCPLAQMLVKTYGELLVVHRCDTECGCELAISNGSLPNRIGGDLER